MPQRDKIGSPVINESEIESMVKSDYIPDSNNNKIDTNDVKDGYMVLWNTTKADRQRHGLKLNGMFLQPIAFPNKIR